MQGQSKRPRLLTFDRCAAGSTLQKALQHPHRRSSLPSLPSPPPPRRSLQALEILLVKHTTAICKVESCACIHASTTVESTNAPHVGELHRLNQDNHFRLGRRCVLVHIFLTAGVAGARPRFRIRSFPHSDEEHTKRVEYRAYLERFPHTRRSAQVPSSLQKQSTQALRLHRTCRYAPKASSWLYAAAA